MLGRLVWGAGCSSGGAEDNINGQDGALFHDNKQPLPEIEPSGQTRLAQQDEASGEEERRAEQSVQLR